jgi:CheY-like chemotaxis protein
VARGQLTIDKQVFDLRDVVARAIETSRPLIESHGHSLHVDIADMPIECLADPLRLTQVIVNILNNAAKYTPDGGAIWLRAERTDHVVELRVRDTGRGIERDQLDRVFDLFIQVDPSVGTALGGLGVGLALVRRIVELHGGYVHANSEGPGKGSEFVVRMPIGTRAKLPQEPVVSAADPTDFHPLRILVIDDNTDAANSLCLLMRSMGHTTEAAHDGPAGLATAQEFAPDLIMLDIGMPVMNGYEVARALRAGKHGYTIVAVTGWGHEAAKRQTREAGFDHHVVKPVAESALVALLAQVAARRRTQNGNGAAP